MVKGERLLVIGERLMVIGERLMVKGERTLRFSVIGYRAQCFWREKIILWQHYIRIQGRG